MTYRPEEDSSEEAKISSDEPEPPAAFNFNAAVPNVDITKALTPQNNFETGDLLVNLLFRVSLIQFMLM